MAGWLLPSSLAAAVKLSWRAADSNTRSASSDTPSKALNISSTYPRHVAQPGLPCRRSTRIMAPALSHKHTVWNSRHMKRPNILFIMADQMAAPILPLHDAASPVRMPNLMKLAEQAVVFDSAYCN